MFTLNCKGKLLSLETPLVMGIINITPDSFYEGSRAAGVSDVLHAAEKMIAEGADILDIGAQSTRPGSERLTAEQELERMLPSLQAVSDRFPGIILSIDTYHSHVAEEAIAAGASMINDISAGLFDEAIIDVAAKCKVPYVLMHMQGTPESMQTNPSYNNVTLDVFDLLNKKVKNLHSRGVQDVIVDPGFGFGKTIQHNFQMLRELSYFNQLNTPLMVGLSRKATVYKTLNTTAEDALNGTTTLNTVALLNGANILRVHDVKEAKEAITLLKAYKK